MQQDPEPQAIDLRELLGVLRRRKWSIALVTILVVAAALALVYHRPKLYTSKAQVEVNPTTIGQFSTSISDLIAGMSTEATHVTSQPVVKLAELVMGGNANSPADVEALTAQVSVSVPSTTRLLDISCTQPSPEAANRCAGAFANGYIADRTHTAKTNYNAQTSGLHTQLAKYNAQISSLSTQLASAPADAKAGIEEQLSVAAASLEAVNTQLAAVPLASATPADLTQLATLPTAPSNKDYVTTGLLALILGLALGIGLAFVRERMDERVAGRESLEEAIDAPVLAVVPQVANWRNKKETRLITLSAPESPAAEAYKTARTTLAYLAHEGNMQVLAVTGPGQGEGKTTTTVNLAVSLAQTGKRVVAVSCDLRRPRLHRFFRLGNEVGLTTLLTGDALVADALKPTDISTLSIIASGPVPQNPAELLGSEAMQGVLDELRSQFDFVLLDTAPALVVADAIALMPYTDGVIVVADAAGTSSAAMKHLRHQFERVGGKVVGGILNNLDPKKAKRYPAYYRSYYSGSYRYRESGEASGNGNGNGHGAQLPGAVDPKFAGEGPDDPGTTDPGMWR